MEAPSCERVTRKKGFLLRYVESSESVIEGLELFTKFPGFCHCDATEIGQSGTSIKNSQQVACDFKCSERGNVLSKARNKILMGFHQKGETGS